MMLATRKLCPRCIAARHLRSIIARRQSRPPQIFRPRERRIIDPRKPVTRNVGFNNWQRFMEPMLSPAALHGSGPIAVAGSGPAAVCDCCAAPLPSDCASCLIAPESIQLFFADVELRGSENPTGVIPADSLINNRWYDAGSGTFSGNYCLEKISPCYYFKYVPRAFVLQPFYDVYPSFGNPGYPHYVVMGEPTDADLVLTCSFSNSSNALIIDVQAFAISTWPLFTEEGLGQFFGRPWTFNGLNIFGNSGTFFGDPPFDCVEEVRSFGQHADFRDHDLGAGGTVEVAANCTATHFNQACFDQECPDGYDVEISRSEPAMSVSMSLFLNSDPAEGALYGSYSGYLEDVTNTSSGHIGTISGRLYCSVSLSAILAFDFQYTDGWGGNDPSFATVFLYPDGVDPDTKCFNGTDQRHYLGLRYWIGLGLGDDILIQSAGWTLESITPFSLP